MKNKNINVEEFESSHRLLRLSIHFLTVNHTGKRQKIKQGRIGPVHKIIHHICIHNSAGITVEVPTQVLKRIENIFAVVG